MNFDERYSQSVGHIGRYQVFLFTVLIIVGITSSFFTLAVVFIGGAGQDYRCQGPRNQTKENVTFSAPIGSNRSKLNKSDSADRCYFDEVLNSSISVLGNASYSGNSSSKARQCHSWMYKRDGMFNTSLKTQTFSKYISLLISRLERSRLSILFVICMFTSGILSTYQFSLSIFYSQERKGLDFNLVCQKEWLISFVQTIYMLGWLVGNFIFGSLSDRYGRMTILPVGFLLQAIVGLAVPFVPNYYGALVLRFLLGAVCGGTDLIRFVITLELCSKKWRTFIGLFSNHGFNGGLVILAWIAYAMEPINHITLQIILGCVPLLFITVRWIVPESPRWLASQGRIEEAEKVIRKIARLNGKPLKEHAEIFDADEAHSLRSLDENDHDDETHQKRKKKTYSVLDLVRTPHLRRVSFALFVMWFVLASIYYGFIFLNKDLGANVYINCTISGVSGIVAVFICIPLINAFGRRSTLVVTMAIMTLSLVVATFLMEKPEYDTALVIIVAIGKFCNIFVFDAIYLQTAEIFPTCIRSMGVGMGSLMARVGALLAPLASNLIPIWPQLPIVLFAVLSLLGTFAELLLPETLGRPLPESIEDGEIFSKFSLEGFCHPCRDKTRDEKLPQRNGNCNHDEENKSEC